MTSLYQSGGQDLDNLFITDPWLIDRFVGGNLYACGYNNTGQLGNGSIVSVSTPVQIGPMVNWLQVATPSYSKTQDFGCSIKQDGTLWSWGYNAFGQLGQNNTTNYSSPVQVGSLTNWKFISLGTGSTLSIKTDGTLWACGNNANGQLGLGTTSGAYSSPVQVGSLTNWKQISMNATDSSMSIKTDNTLWAWGINSYGQLGTGDTNNRSSPVQIGSLNNWKYVSLGYDVFLSIKTDGTLWTSGGNAFGQLGQGNTTSYSSPVQVGSLTNWKQVAGGFKYSTAIKTDGSLWSWGYNAYGQLGTGDTVSYSSPVQIGSLTNWKQISTGYDHTTSIQKNGTLWSWGNNTQGQLGQGTITPFSSPIQVGSLTNWKQVACGYYFTMILNYSSI